MMKRANMSRCDVGEKCSARRRHNGNMQRRYMLAPPNESPFAYKMVRRGERAREDVLERVRAALREVWGEGEGGGRAGGRRLRAYR